MSYDEIENLEQRAASKTRRRRAKKPKMKISGRGALKLQKIIKEKSLREQKKPANQ